MAAYGKPPLGLRPPQYDVITDFSFLTKIHPLKPNDPLPVPTRPPSPPPPARRKLPVVGFIMKPVEEPATLVKQETMAKPPSPPPPPPEPVVRRLKPQVYNLTEQLITTMDTPTALLPPPDPRSKAEITPTALLPPPDPQPTSAEDHKLMLRLWIH